MSDVELAMAEYRRKAGWDGHPEAIEAVWSLAYRSSHEDAAAEGRLLPSPAEHREEYAVEWLTARGGIAMDRMQISSMGEAEHLGPKYVGQYNITDFRVVRRRWQHFSDGSAFAGPWVEVDPDA